MARYNWLCTVEIKRAGSDPSLKIRLNIGNSIKNTMQAMDLNK